MSSFEQRYPEFASIEQLVRRAQAERSVAIATLFADGIVSATRGIGRLFGAKPAERTRGGTVRVKATVAQAARV